MTKEIIEGNTLITDSIFATEYTKKAIIKMDKFEGNHDRLYEVMEYHIKWDLLKPVIDTIYTYSLVHREEVMEVCSAKIVVEIGAMWEKVVRFIQWHNSQSKPLK